MRKLAATAMALPTIARVYAMALRRRPIALRFGIGLVLASIVGAGVILASSTTPTTATPPSVPVPLTQAAFTTAVRSGLELDEPLSIEFNTPMDRASVAAALRVEPAREVDLAWDAAGRTLTIRPAAAWLPDTLHAIVVDPGALAETGQPLAKPVRAVFLTRSSTDLAIAPSRPLGKRVAVDSSFTIRFTRPVATASVIAGLTSDPVLDGTVVPNPFEPAGLSFTFTPREQLPANTKFRLTLSGVRTLDGERLPDIGYNLQTVKAPVVERFRPRAKATNIDRGASISIRFTQPMDRATTKEAITVTANGKAVKGKISFTEDDTVVVFNPKKLLPYSAKVKVSVADTATAAVGTPLGKAAKATFKVEKKPAPIASGGSSGSAAISSGGSGGGGNWASVERYYLGLMNCTRTGGWVTSSGSCSSPGGRNVAALQLDSGISSKVARPYARLLATTGQCSHYADGGPDDRLRRAGYTNYTWGENIGCRSGNPMSAVLATHLFFQSEKPYNGGHYRNLMDPSFSRVGIGVWVSGGNVRLVIDFYHP